MASTVPVQASPFLLFSLPSRARSTPPPRPCRAAANPRIKSAYLLHIVRIASFSSWSQHFSPL